MSDIYPEHRAGWQRTSLDDIVSVVRNRENPQNNPSMPFIGMEQVEPHTMRIFGTVPSSEMRSAAVHFFSGDVLYGRLRPYLNKVVSPDFEGLCSAEFIPLTPRTGISPKFIQYRINSADFVAFASHLDEGDRPRIDFDQIKLFEIDLPPKDEQHRIVAAIEDHFSRLDEAVALLERVRRNLKRYRASVLKAAVEGRLVPTEAALAHAEARTYEPASVLLERILDERRRRWKSLGAKGPYKEPAAPDTSNLPPLPEGWCWATVSQVGDPTDQAVLTGPFGTSMGSADFVGDGVPVLTIGCLTQSGLTLEKAKFVDANKADSLVRYSLREGDLLFSRMATVGRAGVVSQEFRGSLFNYHLMRLRLHAKTIVPTYFLAHVRGSKVVLEYVKDVNHGATRDGINTEQLLNFPIPLPPFNEQNRIVGEIERLTSVVDDSDDFVQVTLRRCKRLRQSILKCAFEGRLVDQDPNDEPASVLLDRTRLISSKAQVDLNPWARRSKPAGVA